MSEGNGLPKGWVEARLGDAVRPRSERVSPQKYGHLPYIGLENIEVHVMRLISTVPASTMKSASARFYPNDVLYGRLRPYLNKVFKPDFDGLCSAEFIVLPESGVLTSKFLQYRINAGDFVSFARHLNTGDRPRVDFEQIGEFIIGIPPLREQHRIVEKIEELFSGLDAGVASLERAKANLKRYRASVLKSAVEGRLTGQASFPNKRLEDLIDSLSQGWSPKCDLAREPHENEWAIIKTTAVQPLAYSDREAKPLPDSLEPRPHLEISEGDFLMTRKGPRQRAGVACLVRHTRPRLMVCDTVYRFRCRPDIVSPAYLEIALNTPVVIQAIDRLKSGINDSGVSLTHDKLYAVSIPLPSLAEQEEIVAVVEERLSQIDSAEKTIDAELIRSKRLRQCILKKAFAGALVRQIATDEPADVLLERIKAPRNVHHSKTYRKAPKR